MVINGPLLSPEAQGGKLNLRLSIDAGDWCKEYSDFIIQSTLDKCQKAKEEGFKGCYGSGCDKMTYKTKGGIMSKSMS